MYTHMCICMCIDNITINPFCNRALFGIQKDIPSFPLFPPLLPPFSQPGENAPFPSFTKKKKKKKKERKKKEMKRKKGGRGGGQRTTKPHQSLVPRTPRKGLYKHTHRDIWLCIKHTENRPQAPQTQQRLPPAKKP